MGRLEEQRAEIPGDDWMNRMIPAGWDGKNRGRRSGRARDRDPHPRGIAFGFDRAGITPVRFSEPTGQAQTGNISRRREGISV